MGKLNLGILGGFSGSVGTVVGMTNKKGDDIIRAKSKRARTSFTEGQRNHQSKFGLVVGHLKVLNDFVKIGFAGDAGDEMSAFNSASKMALSNNVVMGEAPNFAIDFSKLQISWGLLSRENSVEASQKDEMVEFVWSDTSKNGNGDAQDKAILLVYNTDAGEYSCSIGEYTRATKKGSIPLPYSEVGDKLVFYLFFQSVNDPALVSKSQYCGEKLVQ